MFLGIEEKGIGRIGGGKQKPKGRLDFAMIQSLVRDGKVDDRVAECGHVIVDECHHVTVASFERVLSEMKAVRARPHGDPAPAGRSSADPRDAARAGFSVDAKSQSAARPFAHTLVVNETTFRLGTSKLASRRSIGRWHPTKRGTA